jgi:hypothetical protein
MRQYRTFEGTGGPLNYDLVDIDDLKLELGISDSSEDASLALQITRVSKTFADYCDRVFALADVNEIFVFDVGEVFKERQPLVLSHYPIVAIHGVTIDGATNDDYEYDETTGRIWRAAGSAWAGRVEVDYSGGYDLPDDAPPALQWATIEAIRQRRSFSSVDPTIRSTTHGDTSVTFNSEPVHGAAGFSRVIIDAISPYRRITV